MSKLKGSFQLLPRSVVLCFRAGGGKGLLKASFVKEWPDSQTRGNIEDAKSPPLHITIREEQINIFLSFLLGERAPFSISPCLFENRPENSSSGGHWSEHKNEQELGRRIK